MINEITFTASIFQEMKKHLIYIYVEIRHWTVYLTCFFKKHTFCGTLSRNIVLVDTITYNVKQNSTELQYEMWYITEIWKAKFSTSFFN